MIHRINCILDALPSAGLRIGDTILPSYLVFGLSGMVAGTLAMVLLALSTPAHVSVTLGLVSISSVVFLATAFLRRHITGMEGHDLFEDLFAVFIVAAALLAMLRLPVRVYLDLLVVGLSVFLIFGRIGCLMSGCCAGRPAGIGLRYPAECGHNDPNIRRFPVQLIEVFLWTMLSVFNGIFVVLATPGTALSAMLVVYGIARCFLQLLREPSHIRFFGISKPVWLAMASLAAGVVMADRAFLLSRTGAMVAILGGAAALFLIGTRKWWLATLRTLSDAEKEALSKITNTVSQAPPGEQVISWQVVDYQVAAGMLDEQGQPYLSLSVSRRKPALSKVEAHLLLDTLKQNLGIDGPMGEIIRGPNGLHLIFLPWNAF